MPENPRQTDDECEDNQNKKILTLCNTLATPILTIRLILIIGISFTENDFFFKPVNAVGQIKFKNNLEFSFFFNCSQNSTSFSLISPHHPIVWRHTHETSVVHVRINRTWRVAWEPVSYTTFAFASRTHQTAGARHTMLTESALPRED